MQTNTRRFSPESQPLEQTIVGVHTAVMRACSCRWRYPGRCRESSGFKGAWMDCSSCQPSSFKVACSSHISSACVQGIRIRQSSIILTSSFVGLPWEIVPFLSLGLEPMMDLCRVTLR